MSNRIFQFRVWDKELQNMIYDSGMDLMIDSKGRLYEQSEGCISKIKHSENFVLMRKPGFTDKEGKEIYESDIVHYKYDYKGGDNWEVIYEAGEWCLARGNRRTGDENCGDDPHFNKWEEAEILGNIFENPELLENQAQGVLI